MHLFWLAGLITLSSATLAPLLVQKEKVPGQYIVVLKPDVNSDGFKAWARNEEGINIKTEYKIVLPGGFAANMTESALKQLRRRDDVEFVEEDGVVRAITKANTWGQDRIDERDLPLDGSANFAGDGRGVTVYVLDTGIYPEHNDFEGRASVAFDATSSTGDGRDRNGHGTHCAGTLGSKTYGVAREVTLKGVKVLSDSGTGEWSCIISGLDWIAANHRYPSIASASLGGSGEHTSTWKAAAALVDAGVPVIVAAGNDDENACNYSPAGEPKVITVGATTSDDDKAYYSNHGTCVDIFAPGSDIKSTWIDNPTSTYTASGTSMACPHVAGAVAILMANSPTTLTPDQVEQQLIKIATYDVVKFLHGSTPNALLYIGVDESRDVSRKPNPKVRFNRKYHDTEEMKRINIAQQRKFTVL